MFAILTITIPENGMVAHWTALPGKPQPPAASEERVRQLTLFQPIGLDGAFGVGHRLQSAFWAEIAPGNTALYQDVESINGYSAIQAVGYRDGLCFDYMGASCPDIARRLFAVEPSTGLRLVDVLRIDRVVAQRGRLAESFAQEAGEGWVRLRSAIYSEVFIRREPLPAADFSVLPTGTGLSRAERHSTRDTYLVRAGGKGGLLVWARPWYPGYRVRLNGKELAVRPLLRLLPAVELPPGQGGELVIDYVPEGLFAGLVSAAIAVLLLLCFIVWPGLRDRAARRAHSSVSTTGVISRAS
jgi:hypothetical protein